MIDFKMTLARVRAIPRNRPEIERVLDGVEDAFRQYEQAKTRVEVSSAVRRLHSLMEQAEAMASHSFA